MGRTLRKTKSSKGSDHRLIGVELVPDVHRLGKMNLFLHGIEANFLLGDTLAEIGQTLPLADVVTTNPPFGSRKGGDLGRNDLPYPTSNKQFSFLQHVITTLKPGGRAAVIVPDNVLFEDGKGTDIRKHLLNSCNVHTILKLPTGLFYSQGVKTNVLFFTKQTDETRETSDVWVYDLRTGVRAFGRTRPFSREYLAEFEKLYGKDPYGRSARSDQSADGRFRRFSRVQIAESGYSLNMTCVGAANKQMDSSAPYAHVMRAAEALKSALDELETIAKRLQRSARAEVS